jgi:EAL domain-containing protein (putative c-di-GMP-specific phosphodiesterase class I)
LSVTEAQVGLAGAGLTPEQRILSLRYVVDRFAQKGKVEGDGDISGAFAQMMDETQRRLADLTQAVGNGNFQIAYQPICDLSSGKTSHYEALARFNGKHDTGETVQFMEALGIASGFDLAVANKVISLVDQLPDVHVAFNVSAETIANPASFGVLAAMLAKRRRLAPRLLIEVTETGNIGDLAVAGKAIAALREMGYRVGLDDFGAGAASLNYLHAFTVDFVKFDGKLINQIGQSQRDDALLAGLAKLCAEMKVDTIAEWIESEAMARTALGLGFRHGQGRWLGPPLGEIPAAQPVGKRRGVKESWA